VTTTIALAALVALVAAPAAGAKAKGFSLGVAAGDVTSDSAILWAHADKSGTTYLQLTSKGGFGACDADHSAAKVKASKDNDNTVQKTAKKLDAGTAYKYRWCTANGGKSDTGKFTTAPASNKNETIRFALSGDQDARPVPGGNTPYWNNFEVWDAIRNQKNDFNVLLGDTIYSDSEVPGYGLSDVATTVAMKWAAYQINLAMKPWSKTRGSTAYYGHWDDHEFINDFSPSADNFPLSVGTVNIDGNELYDRGVEAFTDYTPVTYSSKNGLYRSVRWGKNLEIFFLDARSFRSTLANYNGNCDNPPGSGNADLAPTAPASTRATFAPIVPQFNNPPPQSCLDAINSPNRTYLGKAQLERFKQEIEKSTATFKVIFNELPIQQQYSNPYDRWEGYAAERTEILNFLHDNVKNVVFLSTDEHANLVLDARFCTLETNCPQNSGIYDIVTGPVATATYSDEINAVLGNPNGGSLIQGAFLKPPPPNGIGEECAAIDQFSYAEVEVTKSQLKVDLLDQNDAPVRDTGERDNITPTTPSCASVVIPKQ
jgi:phosphodiesterase/alkaline phosphatase D-like protein